MKVKQTAKRQLTVRFMGLFALILLLMNVIFIGVSIAFVYDYVSDRSEHIFETIEKSDPSQQNWSDWVDSYVIQDEGEVLQVRLPNGESYYSEDAREAFEDIAKGRSVPFLEHFVFVDDDRYYYEEKEFGDAEVSLIIDSEAITDIVTSLLLANLLLNIVGLIVGALLIYWMVGRWSQKLSKMSNELNQLDETQGYLTVPEDPQEIYQVATAFNTLVEKQRQAIEREKQFVSDASHELRTPITAIRGHVNLIQRRSETHPEVIPQSLEFIDKESKRIELLSEQLLTLGRVENKNNLENIDFSSLVTQEVENLALTSGRKITLQVASEIYFKAAKTDLQQIIKNLLENALKYAPTGEIKVLLQKNEQICLQIADQGIGIADDEKEKIFERLYRIDQSRSSEVNGSGVGLSIVKALVTKYRGTIQVEDNQPKGTIFTITFPKK
ncbi:sensor histidine kinase [Tetragenococcus halophilus]|uniref:sensor histidine kinase n=1 Tax=Tetragenococcus halophilus TaxID=51669 RepID=UPI0021BAAD49|nr:HAMP domain-containing sensor histidine kinase [Tetragenococcus halophilus]MCT8309573.1 HAMP domain-containing histidine kinase [Tetragenococcus halophilus]GMG71344.1 HAMP domain-containing sensor histidine kinase [Tetragenococcus halophilus]GMQ73610.1 HAMP domain-containing sensor histidine kinase [Tetragenococcus halophilus]